MKRNLTLRKIRLFCLLLVISGSAMAQSEIVVEPGFNTIIDAVTANPGATLVLKRGGEYVVDKPVEINNPMIIRGETEPAATKPAVVSLYADPGTAGEQPLFSIAANVTLKDFGMIAHTFDDQAHTFLIQIVADNLTVVCDGLICQSFGWFIYPLSSANLNITQKNCVLFNVSHVGFDNGGFGGIVGWAATNLQWKSYNNTFFTAGRVFNAFAAGPDGGDLMDHNTYVNTYGDMYYPHTEDNFVVQNNIMFNTNMRGYVGKRYGQDSVLLYGGDFSDFGSANPRDSLQGDIVIQPNKIDSANVGNSPRNIAVNNNLKFTEARVYANQIEATGSPQPLINDSILMCFAKYGWTLQNNTLDNSINPQFAMGTIPDEAFFTMFTNRLDRGKPAELRDPNFPYPYFWSATGTLINEFQWPLPFDFKPTNAAVLTAGTDGYPLGDLNWFGKDVVKNWEDGKPNSVKNFKNESNQSAYIANDMLRFKGFDKAVNAEIYSILGQKLLVAENINELNVSSLKRGVYLVRVNNGSQAFRVVK